MRGKKALIRTEWMVYSRNKCEWEEITSRNLTFCPSTLMRMENPAWGGNSLDIKLRLSLYNRSIKGGQRIYLYRPKQYSSIYWDTLKSRISHQHNTLYHNSRCFLIQLLEDLKIDITTKPRRFYLLVERKGE
ncbi:unnamed protein product [marine sediment metagenome]|uniref:Uncharacterized protein n=1 Tax=marine sediment metagenome TaxID=412755 RepID=X0WJL9_9ZZZZ